LKLILFVSRHEVRSTNTHSAQRRSIKTTFYYGIEAG